MVSAPPVGSPSAENCFHVTSNMEFGWKALSFVDLSAKSVESPVTESLMLLSPPGLHWQHGAWQKVNAISVCVEPNWLTSGTRYKADSALHAELLWELSQALLCLGKQIEKKKPGKSHSRCVLCLNEPFFCRWSNFEKSPSSSSHDPISTLVTGWKDFICVLVKSPVKGFPCPPFPPHLPPFPWEALMDPQYNSDMMESAERRNFHPGRRTQECYYSRCDLSTGTVP